MQSRASVVIALAVALLTALNAGQVTAQPLAIHYSSEFSLNADGVPDFVAAANVARWASAAGLQVRWLQMPFKRSLEDLKRGRGKFCVVGAFITRERLRYTRYSVPLLPADPRVLLAAKRMTVALRAMPDVRSAVLDPRFTILVEDGGSYGEDLDRWIAERVDGVQRVTFGTIAVAAILSRGRADFTISTQVEFDRLHALAAADIDQVELVSLPGMPPAPTRHLACSLSVPVAWLAQFDEAARRVGYAPQQPRPIPR
jgi:hypothetical protein